MSKLPPPLQTLLCDILLFVVQLPLKKAMSEGLLSTLSCLDDEGLEVEKDAGLADSPHIADAMTEGDNEDAVAKMALALVSLHFGNNCLSQSVQ